MKKQQTAIALLMAALVVSGGGSVARAQPVCQGRDMIAEIKAGDQTAYERMAKQAATTVNTEAMLWRIERDGIAPSYLLGTAHVSDPRINALSPKVAAALDLARQVAFEVADLSPETMAAAVAHNVQLFVYADGRQLDGVLPQDQFDKAADVLAKAGMPQEVAVHVKPWLVFLMLSVPECERKRQASGLHALDMQLTERARKQGKPVVGLETIESQLGALAAIPEDQQVAMLRAVLFHVDRTEDQMETTLQLYLKRQMGFAIPLQHELARRAGIEPSAFASFDADIVVRRNGGMAKAALPLLEKGATFIGVGALHLVGESGLVAQFRKAGYTVTAVE